MGVILIWALHYTMMIVSSQAQLARPKLQSTIVKTCAFTLEALQVTNPLKYCQLARLVSRVFILS